MRLSHAIALSLVLHLVIVWGLTGRTIYGDGGGAYRNGSRQPVFSVSIPSRLATSPGNASRIKDNRSPEARQPEYLASSAVDKRAEPADIEPLIIPERAYIKRIRGEIKLRAYIDEAGKVRKIEILFAKPVGVFERAAIDAVAGTIFSPARLGGMPVKTYKDLEIDIDPYESIRVP